MSESILDSTKKVLGIDATYTVFDQDIIMHINSVFADLHQLGVGPDAGFMIEDSDGTWDQLFGNDPRLNSVKTYVYLRLRLVFDPPANAFVVTAMEKQIEKMEWRINVAREVIVHPAPLEEV